MKGFCDLGGVLWECHKIHYLRTVMGQKVNLRKVEGGLLEDVMDCLLSLVSVFRISFCALRGCELEILVNSSLPCLTFPKFLSDLCCFLMISLTCPKFGKNVDRLVELLQIFSHVS